MASVLFNNSPSSDAYWKTWSTWGPCSLTCNVGANGIKTRVRECKDGFQEKCGQGGRDGFDVCQGKGACPATNASQVASPLGKIGYNVVGLWIDIKCIRANGKCLAEMAPLVPVQQELRRPGHQVKTEVLPYRALQLPSWARRGDTVLRNGRCLSRSGKYS